MKRSMLVALGSNLASPKGGPETLLSLAVEKLSQRGAAIRALSPFYHTPAFPAGGGPDFVNAAAEISADWTPQQALLHLHSVEADLGRVRAARWGQRTIDLDLLACGDQVLPDAKTFARWRNMALDVQMAQAPDELILPHPRLQERGFVLVPLADIAPDWVHPVLGQSVKQMLAALPQDQTASVRPLR